MNLAFKFSEPISDRKISYNEPTWARKISYEAYQTLLAGDELDTAQQYDQNPTVLEGGLFKRKSFKYHTKTISEHWSEFQSLIICADTAMKTGDANDYSVLMLLAHGLDGNVYVMDIVREKLEAPQLEEALIALFDKYRATYDKPLGVSRILIEDKASGTGLIQGLNQKSTKLGIPTVEGIKANTDKVTRAIGIVPQFAAGRVYFNDNEEFLQQTKELEQELLQFTLNDTHPYDDQIDALEIGVRELLLNNGSLDYGSF